MSAWLGKFIVELLEDKQDAIWSLAAYFGFNSDVAKIRIEPPIGTLSNFCSVPHVPVINELFGDKYRMSGFIHDYLYESKIISREVADEVLREMLLLQGASHQEAMAFYLAVRKFGGSHWDPEPAMLPLPVDLSGP